MGERGFLNLRTKSSLLSTKVKSFLPQRTRRKAAEIAKKGAFANGAKWDSRLFLLLLRFLLLLGEQAEDADAVGGADVDFAIGDGRSDELVADTE